MCFCYGHLQKKYGSELPSFNIDELTTVQPISREPGNWNIRLVEVTKILKLAATPSDFSDRVFRYGDIGIKGFQNIKHLWDQNPFFSRSFFMGSLNLDIPKVVPTKDFWVFQLFKDAQCIFLLSIRHMWELLMLWASLELRMTRMFIYPAVW